MNVLKEVDVVCIPTKSPDMSFDKSITYKIVQEALQMLEIEKELIPIYFPMNFLYEDWFREASTIVEATVKYDKVAFVILGDAAVYSSIYYLLDIIKKIDSLLYESSEVIAGVTSFML